MKAIILARVSSKDPKEEGQSMPVQVNKLTDYAHKKNLAVERVFQITDASAQNTRKQFDQILALIKASQQPIALITDTVNHLQKSLRATPILDELRKAGKVEIHFLREGLVLNKSSNNSDLMRWDMGVMLASNYIRQINDKAMCLL